MKILALSLLRVGDLILHEKILQGLQMQYPQAEIHLLINEVSVPYAQSLNPGYPLHIFPRNLLQADLLQSQRSILQAYRRLQTTVEKLQTQKFSLVINLTHTQFSVRLMDLLSGNKLGVGLHNGKVIPSANPWQQHLNETWSEQTDTAFHYLDVLANSLQIPLPAPAQIPNDLRLRPFLCLQTLTSDPKKNWPVPSFRLLIKKLQAQFAQKKIIILSAPDELPLLQSQYGDLSEIEIRCVRWSEFPDLLQQTALLITGDTSVQHLAAKHGTPILSLFLGGANPLKTCPVANHAVILQPHTACQPCRHSQPCHQPQHFCAMDLRVEDVALVAQTLLQGKSLQALNLQRNIQCKMHQVQWPNPRFLFLQRIDGAQEDHNNQRLQQQNTLAHQLDQRKEEHGTRFSTANDSSPATS